MAITTSKTKKPRAKAKRKPSTKQPVKVKKFNHDVSIFTGELGLTKDDLTVIEQLLHHIANDEKQRLNLFERNTFQTQTSNLYRIKYKIEALLHGKSC